MRVPRCEELLDMKALDQSMYVKALILRENSATTFFLRDITVCDSL